MTDIEVSLATKLGTLAKVYPLQLPEKPDLPAIVYQRISTTHQRTHEGTGFDTPRFQLSLYSKTYSTVRTLAESVNTLLDLDGDGALGIMFAENTDRRDLIDEESGLYRIILDFFVWHN